MATGHKVSATPDGKAIRWDIFLANRNRLSFRMRVDQTDVTAL
jgi:hypothetical protein